MFYRIEMTLMKHSKLQERFAICKSKDVSGVAEQMRYWLQRGWQVRDIQAFEDFNDALRQKRLSKDTHKKNKQRRRAVLTEKMAKTKGRKEPSQRTLIDDIRKEQYK